jgi:hypothetical protein
LRATITGSVNFVSILASKRLQQGDFVASQVSISDQVMLAPPSACARRLPRLSSRLAPRRRTHRSQLAGFKGEETFRLGPDLQLGKLHPRMSIGHPLTSLILRGPPPHLNAEDLCGGLISCLTSPHAISDYLQR